jgi:ribosomal-protein-alanine N-acetyltransferase
VIRRAGAHLRTERTTLRLAESDEAHLVVDYLERNRPHLARWEPDPPHGFYTEAYWRERLAQLRREEDEGRQARFHLFEKSAPVPRIVGTVGLSNIVRGAFHCAHLGFGLDASLEGRGLMREALEAVIAQAFGPMNLHRLEANHQPHNFRSAGLLARPRADRAAQPALEGSRGDERSASSDRLISSARRRALPRVITKCASPGACWPSAAPIFP